MKVMFSNNLFCCNLFKCDGASSHTIELKIRNFYQSPGPLRAIWISVRYITKYKSIESRKVVFNDNSAAGPLEEIRGN